MTWLVLYLSLYFIVFEFYKMRKTAKYIDRVKKSKMREFLTICPPYLVLINSITVILHNDKAQSGNTFLTIPIADENGNIEETTFENINNQVKYSSTFWIIQLFALLLSLLNAIN